MPVVTGNHAPQNVDIGLASGCVLTVTGTLEDGAKIGVALNEHRGTFTSQYTKHNADTDPSEYFVSTESYTVLIRDKEACNMGKDPTL